MERIWIHENKKQLALTVVWWHVWTAKPIVFLQQLESNLGRKRKLLLTSCWNTHTHTHTFSAFLLPSKHKTQILVLLSFLLAKPVSHFEASSVWWLNVPVKKMSHKCPRCHCIMAWTFHPGVEVKVGMHFVRSERHAGAAHQRSPGPTHLGLPGTAWRTVQFFSCDEVYNFETGKKPNHDIWFECIALIKQRLVIYRDLPKPGKRSVKLWRPHFYSVLW